MQARIYQNIKPPTLSGPCSHEWIIDFHTDQNFFDDTMGWASSKCTISQLKLKFTKLSEAKEFAKEKGWRYEVIESNPNKKFTKKSYSDNFT